MRVFTQILVFSENKKKTTKKVILKKFGVIPIFRNLFIQFRPNKRYRDTTSYLFPKYSEQS